MPELQHAVRSRQLQPDGSVVTASGEVNCTKAAVEPVWYLPGVAERFGLHRDRPAPPPVRADRRHVPRAGDPRPISSVFLPPIGGQTVYIFGDVAEARRPDAPLACRVHDECNGSDVFGSDICTCRPYLVHGIEECIRDARRPAAPG